MVEHLKGSKVDVRDWVADVLRCDFETPLL